MLIAADGTARLLSAEPDPLIGIGGAIERGDHRIELQPGASVVFYTDGLIERRDESLTTRLDWLVGELAARRDLSAEELCDRVLVAAGDQHEDDVAVLVLRIAR